VVEDQVLNRKTGEPEKPEKPETPKQPEMPKKPKITVKEFASDEGKPNYIL
jgi:hypothetical protein